VPELSLEIVEGAGAGRMVAVAGTVTIGRGRDADLVLADELVSRRHAQVTPVGPGAVVEDLGSRNGTFVNGEGIHGPVRLAPGDQLQLGVSLVELRSAGQIAERPSAVHPVPPPLAVPTRAPDYLAGADTDEDASLGVGAAAPADRAGSPRAPDPATPVAAHAAAHPAAPDPAAAGPLGGTRHELDPLLDSRVKGKARTAPLALFVLAALVVIIFLATTR
jgi:predicted component of type VI protein secretion system